MSFSRAARRRLHRAIPLAEAYVESDMRFFERFPHRNFRVRLSGPVELEQIAASKGASEAITQAGFRWITVIRQLAPGVRCRVFAQASKVDDLDLPEEYIAGLYGRLTPIGSKMRTIEDQLRAKLVELGGHS